MSRGARQTRTAVRRPDDTPPYRVFNDAADLLKQLGESRTREAEMMLLLITANKEKAALEVANQEEFNIEKVKCRQCSPHRDFEISENGDRLCTIIARLDVRLGGMCVTL